MPVGTLQVGRERESFFARVAGRGDYGLGPVLEEQALSAIQDGARTVVVDFQSCSYLDSTFLGALVCIACSLREVSGRIILNCISPWIHERLHTMGLSHLFDEAEAPFEEALQGRPEPTLSHVSAPELTREEAARYIIKAHQRLVAMCPSHREHLNRVVEALRREIDSRDPGRFRT